MRTDVRHALQVGERRKAPVLRTLALDLDGGARRGRRMAAGANQTA